MKPRTILFTLAVASLAITGCSAPPVDLFTNTIPAFDPIVFFTGHVRSWGVIESRSGDPTSIITTDSEGSEEPGRLGAGLHLIQHLTQGTDRQTRDWHLIRTAPGHYEATANDIVGTAIGETQGRTFHLRYTLALKPGNTLMDVAMDQWMYAMEDGSMVNRATIGKLGIILAEVTEHFTHSEQDRKLAREPDQ